MIKLDEHGIVVQHSKTDPNYADGGDSCARTGLLALANFDHFLNLSKFVVLGGIVRHPTQEVKAEGMKYPYTDPRATSRDNVIQWATGIAKASSQSVRDVCYYYARQGWVNKDFLDFACRLYLWQKSGTRPPLWLHTLGYVNLAASLVWNTKIKPDDEQNQFACMMIHFGPKWCQRFRTWHPDLKKNIMEYWSGWRDQPEIGKILCDHLGL